MRAYSRPATLIAGMLLAACNDIHAPTAIQPGASPQAGRTPTAVFALSSVAVGSFTSCGLASGGAAYCWGANGSGQLGDGTTTTFESLPSPVVGGISFVAISPGGGFTCGLAKSGQAYCWGAATVFDHVSALGRGDSPTDPQLPGPVLGGLTFTAITAGSSGACGLTRAGEAYCWGHNSNGTLGTGAAVGADVFVPAPVIPPAGSSTPLTFVSLSMGAGVTCGVVKGGQAYCWGNNGVGSNGDGTNDPSLAPVAVAGGNTFVAITAGDAHACGILKTGQAVCWGANGSGELGDNTTTNSNVPRLVSTGLTFTSISAGSATTCAVTSRGTAYCWGRNDFGQVGDGTTIERHAPTAVAGGFTFTSVDAGGNGHVCGLTDRLGAWCWGLGTSGELGNGTVQSATAPTAVQAP